MSDDLMIYRSRFVLIVILAACVLFTGVLLYVQFHSPSPLKLPYEPTPSFAFLLFLIVCSGWIAYLLRQSHRPVITIRGEEVIFSAYHRPKSSATVRLCDVRSVSVEVDDDTVPAYLILEFDQLDDQLREAVVWMRREKHRLYFECSNLTLPPSEIARKISQRTASAREQATRAF